MGEGDIEQEQQQPKENLGVLPHSIQSRARLAGGAGASTGTIDGINFQRFIRAIDGTLSWGTSSMNDEDRESASEEGEENLFGLDIDAKTFRGSQGTASKTAPPLSTDTTEGGASLIGELEYCAQGIIQSFKETEGPLRSSKTQIRFEPQDYKVRDPVTAEVISKTRAKEKRGKQMASSPMKKKAGKLGWTNDKEEGDEDSIDSFLKALEEENGDENNSKTKPFFTELYALASSDDDEVSEAGGLDTSRNSSRRGEPCSGKKKTKTKPVRPVSARSSRSARSAQSKRSSGGVVKKKTCARQRPKKAKGMNSKTRKPSRKIPSKATGTVSPSVKKAIRRTEKPAKEQNHQLEERLRYERDQNRRHMERISELKASVKRLQKDRDKLKQEKLAQKKRADEAKALLATKSDEVKLWTKRANAAMEKVKSLQRAKTTTRQSSVATNHHPPRVSAKNGSSGGSQKPSSSSPMVDKLRNEFERLQVTHERALNELRAVKQELIKARRSEQAMSVKLESQTNRNLDLERQLRIASMKSRIEAAKDSASPPPPPPRPSITPKRKNRRSSFGSLSSTDSAGSSSIELGRSRLDSSVRSEPIRNLQAYDRYRKLKGMYLERYAKQ